jgi:hypothetical protein
LAIAAEENIGLLVVGHMMTSEVLPNGGFLGVVWIKQGKVARFRWGSRTAAEPAIPIPGLIYKDPQKGAVRRGSRTLKGRGLLGTGKKK